MVNGTSHDLFAALDTVLGKTPDDVVADATPVDMKGMFHDAITARQYINGGKATITLRSKKTDTRFTYRITAATDRETGQRTGDGTLFVGVLTGPDNETNYSYLGRVSRGVFWRGRKNPRPGDVSPDAPSSKAFDWAWRKLAQDQLPDALEVWHEGRCGRCGHKLTVPSSVASGFGPECIKHVGGLS